MSNSKVLTTLKFIDTLCAKFTKKLVIVRWVAQYYNTQMMYVSHIEICQHR